MTSNDRHAGPNSPYRSSQHLPLSQSKNNPLAAGPGALESRTDLNTDLEAGSGGFINNTSSPPFSPGLQKNPLSRQNSGMDSKMESIGQGEIQMQSFSDGLPPPPPVSHSWRRIDRWMEDNYEELFENLGQAATINDVNELEHELDCSLPQEVRESLQVHDGQERGGMPTGVLFGCMLLDCEEIYQEWQNWRTVNEAYLDSTASQRGFEIPQAPLKAFAGSSSSSSAVPVAQNQQSTNNNNPHWRAELQDKQDSQPPNAIQKVYTHPAWIPLARDWGGNNIAVDLAPGPTGKWGQIILMGRDYDCKYVIARSWAAFLATLADDMSSEKWFIDENTQELKLREFKQPGVEPAYIDILRWRSDQKYGRRRLPGRKRGPLRINSDVPAGQNGFSPYGSPTSADGDGRGRSPHRNGKAAVHHHHANVGSPLARVAEEAVSSPQQQHQQPPQKQPAAGPLKSPPLKVDTSNLPDASASKGEKLISGIDTPRSAVPPGEEGERRSSIPFPKSRLGSVVSSGTEEQDDSNGTGEMKDVKI